MKMVLKLIVGVRLQGNEEWKLSQNNMHLCFPVVKRQFGPLFDICNLTLTWTDPNWAWGGYHGYETWSYMSNTKKSLHMYAGSVPAQVIRSGFPCPKHAYMTWSSSYLNVFEHDYWQVLLISLGSRKEKSSSSTSLWLCWFGSWVPVSFTYVQTMVLQCSRVPTCSMSVVSNLQMVLNWVLLPLVLKVELFIEHSQGCISLASSHTMHDAAVS
jgi:hypothetical protein